MLKNKEIDKCNSILNEINKIGDLDYLSKNLYNKFHRLIKNKKINTPCYIIDKKGLEENINKIKNSFYKYFNSSQLNIFYPIKINNHKYILKTFIKHNIGMEVASIDEYKLALSLDANRILYYAPGKKESDLEFFIKNSNNNHIIHVDSFNELEKLINLLQKFKKNINIGVRIFTDDFGEWQKYGINLNDLNSFINKACTCEYINFSGIHFHTSRNKNSNIYTKTIKKISRYLKNNLDSKNLKKIKYIDFGGGFEKNKIEGTYFKGTKKGMLKNLLGELTFNKGNEIILLESQDMDSYVRDIYASINDNILPLGDIKFFTEPGRIFVSDIMHILSKVVDVKDSKNNIVILDAGVNMIGWQRGEFEYFPVINLSSEYFGNNKKALIYGNLCTTWDHWGYYCYSKKNLKENDLILLANQGTLSYSLAQKFFINKLPKTYII